jgi:hypothetical protein
MTTTTLRPQHRSLRLSLEAWVSRLVEEFPGFDEYDIAELIEERTGLPVQQRDFEAITALYLRSKLRAWQPDVNED